jgi:hypothetical protein
MILIECIKVNGHVDGDLGFQKGMVSSEWSGCMKMIDNFFKGFFRGVWRILGGSQGSGMVPRHSNIDITLRGAARPFNCMDTLYFLAYFGDIFFSLFSIIWGHSVTTSCRSWAEVQWPKFEVGLWYCYFHKKIAHLGFQALIYVVYEQNWAF